MSLFVPTFWEKSVGGGGDSLLKGNEDVLWFRIYSVCGNICDMNPEITH